MSLSRFRKHPYNFLPRFEVLEDRAVPAVAIPGLDIAEFALRSPPAPGIETDYVEVSQAAKFSRDAGELAQAFAALEEIEGVDDFLGTKAVIKLKGVSASSFNSVDATVTFAISKTSFSTNLVDVSLLANGNLVPDEQLSLSKSKLVAKGILSDGQNDLQLRAIDKQGNVVFFNTTLWAGSQTLTVQLVNEAQKPISGAKVLAVLGDDPNVFAQGKSKKGAAVFKNVPERTILLEARASKNRFGELGVVGTSGTVVVVMNVIEAPSDIANNDFSLGTDGWNVGSTPVQVVPQSAIVAEENALLSSALAAAEDTDFNLVLSTSGQGEQSISRTFKTQPGTTSVKVRFRFITSEIPGGFFGTEFNDYFRVTIRSQKGGGFVTDGNSMNALGLGAFDAQGATRFREVTLPVNAKGDIVQVDATVANVADGLFDSSIEIDAVLEEKAKFKYVIDWDTKQGGLKVTYTVLEKNVEEDTTVSIFWANGTASANKLGGAIHSFVVPAGTKKGAKKTERVPGNVLTDDPAGTTHILVASDDADAQTIQDVSVGFGAAANSGVVSQATVGIVKDLLRQAGKKNVTITSTARTPADQARAMFNNCLPAGGVAAQKALYGPNGDQVIDVFVAETAGLTSAQIQQQATQIKQAMEDKINDLGPSTVSKHCLSAAEYAVRNVIDIGFGAFTTSTKNLFRTAGQSDARIAKFLDEPKNSCFHLEIPQ